MKRFLGSTLWYILGAATVWQIYESLRRCGSIDGGAILIPMLIFFYVVGKDTWDIRAAIMVDKPIVRGSSPGRY